MVDKSPNELSTQNFQAQAANLKESYLLFRVMAMHRREKVKPVNLNIRLWGWCYNVVLISARVTGLGTRSFLKVISGPLHIFMRILFSRKRFEHTNSNFVPPNHY